MDILSKKKKRVVLASPLWQNIWIFQVLGCHHLNNVMTSCPDVPMSVKLEIISWIA